jgi:hypothetical protein
LAVQVKPVFAGWLPFLPARELSQLAALSVRQAAKTLKDCNNVVNKGCFTLAALCFMVEFEAEKVVQ